MHLKSLLKKPVDGGSLAFMRIAVGLVMILEAYTLFHPSQSTNGETPLKAFYTGADIHITFPYQAFEWLPLLKPHGIYWVVGIMAVGGLLMAIGLFYRAAAAAVFLTWGYLYAVEATRTYWMSYYYVELLLTFLLIWMPAANKYSVDAWLARNRNPEGIIPFWPIFVLRAQLVITYFYAGVAKLNSDWLVNAEPVRYFLYKAKLVAELGPRLSPEHLDWLKSVLQNDGLAYFLSWAGAAFDLSVGFLLLARRTRILGMVLMFIFHTTNHFIIFEDLEWFPLVGLVTSLIFLEPDWPHRLWRWLHKPRIAKPDLEWLGFGALLVPVVGAALGWKLAPSPQVPAKRELQISRWTVGLVACWLIWQALMPLRHYFIAGDGRFTWEGLSFSWRLKADLYRSAPCTITINDPGVFSTEPSGITKINWANWPGEKVIYRSFSPTASGWQKLPEVMVILEPQTGERVIYNPCSGMAGWRSEADARARVQAIWQEVYGRQPQAILRTFPFSAVLSSYAGVLQSKGQLTGNPNDPAWLPSMLKKHGSEGDGQLLPVLRRATPFGTQVETPAAMPFLVIDDEALYHPALTNVAHVDRKAWVNSPYAQLPGSSNSGQTSLTNEPLVIYATDIHIETKDLLPQSFLCDSAASPFRPVSISWNYLKELSMSEGMHVSMQPFFLRRYAQHVAGLWEKEYGRRPMVNVDTQVSLNGRPFQRLVDPQADLASVPAKWFEHNWWIRDLEMPEIQNDGLVPRAPRR